MELIEYVKNEFKQGPELFRDEIHITNKKGVTITRNTERLRRMSLGLVSCNDATEWYNLCRQVCEPGTIIKEYTEDWKTLFDDYSILVRNQLTLQLLQERREKSAKTLLDILSRRDKQHWAEDKGTKTTTATINKESNDIVVKFEVAE